MMLKRLNRYIWLIVLTFGSFAILSAQEQTAPNHYWVQFSDKNGSLYSLDEPSAFLSERAIQRRLQQQIPIDSTDLPVPKIYTDSLTSLGIKVLYTSRWFNAATIYSTDAALLDTLDKFSFVQAYQPKQIAINKNSDTLKKVKWRFANKGSNNDDYTYHHQINMLKGDFLHNKGFTGNDMLIAVLDAGFNEVDSISSLTNLRQEGRIQYIRDYVFDGIPFYQGNSHGTKVLTVMAGDFEGMLHGSAVDANYALMRTENAVSEYPIEGDNWIAGAEFADSIGADVINSSLGYFTFDDTVSSYAYNDMDGNTTRVTKASDMAAAKGMLVVTSAGNEGNKPWTYITAPADGDSVLTVGAVDSQGNAAPFTSRGPSFDGRVKPNIGAMGQGVYHQGVNGIINQGNGTSYSSPIIAGLATCLWQAFPEATNMDILNAIQQSASLYPFHDSLIGYGIPDFQKAYFLLQQDLSSNTDILMDHQPILFPNPFTDTFYIVFNKPNNTDTTSLTLKIYDLSSQFLHQATFYTMSEKNIFTVNELPLMSPGTYVVVMYDDEDIVLESKIIKAK